MTNLSEYFNIHSCNLWLSAIHSFPPFFYSCYIVAFPPSSFLSFFLPFLPPSFPRLSISYLLPILPSLSTNFLTFNVDVLIPTEIGLFPIFFIYLFFIFIFISTIFRQRCPVQRGWFKWGSV